jgi:hypothetical protein
MTRVAILYDCLTAARRYMTTIVALTTSEMSLWTAFKWRQLDYIIKLGSKITHVLYANTFAEDSLARMVKFERRLDQLCTRIRAILQWTNTPPGEPHYFQRLLDQWETIRVSFKTSIERSTLQSQQPQHQSQQQSQQPQHQPIGTTALPADLAVINHQTFLEGEYTYLDTWSNAEFWLDSLTRI